MGGTCNGSTLSEVQLPEEPNDVPLVNERFSSVEDTDIPVAYRERLSDRKRRLMYLRDAKLPR